MAISKELRQAIKNYTKHLRAHTNSGHCMMDQCSAGYLRGIVIDLVWAANPRLKRDTLDELDIYNKVEELVMASYEH